MYHPPVGVWKTTPERRVLWALEQVLHKVAVEQPEKNDLRKWRQRIERDLRAPVLKFNWAKWYRDNVEGQQTVVKDEPPHWDVPAAIVASWDEIPPQIIYKLWKQAAAMRAKAHDLPFNEGDLRAGMDATMSLVRSIPDSQIDVLRRVMQRSMEQGEGQFGFARRIREEWVGISKAKAEQIAVTEWNRAASTATLQGLQRQGVSLKRWFTAGDSRVCPICEDNAADGEIPVNEGFFSGDDAPPAHPSCRCNVSGA